MSRVGSRPIKIEDGVTVQASNNKVIVSSGNQSLELPVFDGLAVDISERDVKVTRSGDTKELRSKHGLLARLIKNAILGTKQNFERVLEFTGTGYRAAVTGDELVLNMGYSHEIRLPIPETLKVAVAKNNIIISGVEKEKVGQFAANVREIRPPEVYKGKGIRYRGEIIKRKAGKTAASK